MKKIYQFSSTNDSRFLSIEEKQSSADEITIRVHCEDDEFILPFKVEEFKELCYLQYRLEFTS
jgi:hypothetical protein